MTALKSTNPELVKEADELLKKNSLWVCICCSTDQLGSCTLVSFDSIEVMLVEWDKLKNEGLSSRLFESSQVSSDIKETVSIFFDYENQDSHPTECTELDDVLGKLGVEQHTLNSVN
ncbi:conserved hypothetical protein [Vibrio chagasii]|nr:conserved hypothetical protein [Vibrio chagasii]